MSDAVSLAAAIHAGDVDEVRRLVAAHPELATGPLGGSYGDRTALHVVTDWPGYFPNGPEIVRVLVEAGADINARPPGGPGSETPLHWAASNDDADVARALIDGGADIEAAEGSIGTPLDNAIGYSCWNVAALLVERGARVERLWQASALGRLDLLEELGSAPGVTTGDISQAFWHACAGGQRRAAEWLLNRGADLNWTPDYAHGTALDAALGIGTRRENVIEWLREKGAQRAPE
jgi:ankyrin repeat protein